MRLKGSKKKPNIFDYEDYRVFIRDWINYRKAIKPGWGMKNLAEETGIAASYISAALKGRRGFSDSAWDSLTKGMSLKAPERNYLSTIRSINEDSSLENRFEAMNHLHRCRSYREKDPGQAEIYQYMSKWYNVAIRELAALKTFRADPEWIQENLVKKVPIKSIRNALQFLEENGFIEIDEKGMARMKDDKDIVGKGDFYRTALKKFHKDLLHIGADTIEEVESEHRNITGETLPIHKSQLPKLKEILDNARKEVAKLSREEVDPDSVYHVYFLAFPLNKQGAKG